MWRLLSIIIRLFLLYILLRDYWICLVRVKSGWLIVIIGVCEGFKWCMVFLIILMEWVIIVNEWVFLINIGSSVIIVGWWDDSDMWEEW